MALLQYTHSFNVKLILLSLLSIGLMTLDHRGTAVADFRSLIQAYLIYPIQSTVNIPFKVADSASQSWQTREELLERNDNLVAENRFLQARQLQFESLVAENQRLRALFNSSFAIDNELVIAAVLQVDQDPLQQRIIINKGRRDGVFVGQAMVDAYGIVGQIVSVNPYSATAILVADPAHAIPVNINRNGLRTIANGTGQLNELNLSYLPNNADVQVGDLLVSSGLAGRFPANYPVARVTNIMLMPGRPFASITAEPLAQLDRIREVLLVIPSALETTSTEAVTTDSVSAEAMDETQSLKSNSDEVRPRDGNPARSNP